ASIPMARSLSATWRGVREELLVRNTGRAPRLRSSAIVGGAWGTASSPRYRTPSRSNRMQPYRSASISPRCVRGRARSPPSRGASRSRASGARSPSCAAPCVRTRAQARSARSRSPARSARPWRTRAGRERPGRTCRAPVRGPHGSTPCRARSAWRARGAWRPGVDARRGGTPCRARRARRHSPGAGRSRGCCYTWCVSLVSPFVGLLFDGSIVGSHDLVTTPPYDVISDDERRHYLEASPYNVIRLVLGRGEAGEGGTADKYRHAASELDTW